MINFFKNKKIIEVLKKLERYKYIILILIVLGFAFYWFEIRSNQIKRSCYTEATQKISSLNELKGFGPSGLSLDDWLIKHAEIMDGYPYSEDKKDFEWFYKNCLKRKGL